MPFSALAKTMYPMIPVAHSAFVHAAAHAAGYIHHHGTHQSDHFNTPLGNTYLPTMSMAFTSDTLLQFRIHVKRKNSKSPSSEESSAGPGADMVYCLRHLKRGITNGKRKKEISALQGDPDHPAHLYPGRRRLCLLLLHHAPDHPQRRRGHGGHHGRRL